MEWNGGVGRGGGEEVDYDLTYQDENQKFDELLGLRLRVTSNHEKL